MEMPKEVSPICDFSILGPDYSGMIVVDGIICISPASFEDDQYFTDVFYQGQEDFVTLMSPTLEDANRVANLIFAHWNDYRSYLRDLNIYHAHCRADALVKAAFN